MSHHIQAFIGSRALLEGIRSEFSESKVIELTQGLSLFPLTDELYDAIPAAGPPVRADEGFKFLDAKIKQLLLTHSRVGGLGYIETDYWGGDGDQGAVLASNGEIVFGPQKGDGTINALLSLMGVKINDSHDEFAAVGLGRFRSNEDWIEQPIFPKRSAKPTTILNRLKALLLGVKGDRRS